MRLDGLDPRVRARVKFIIDLCLWSAAGLFAFPLRQPEDWFTLGSTLGWWMLATLPLRAALIGAFRLHRQVWRQVTVKDLQDLLKALALGTAALFLVGLAWHEIDGFPRTAPLIGGVLAVIAMGGVRLTARLWFEDRARGAIRESGDERRVVLVGAGIAGARMAREIRRHPNAAMTVVGFLDDDAAKHRLTVSGLPVLGSLDHLPELVRLQAVDEVLITMPSASGATTRAIVDRARESGVRCRILPGVTEILAGEIDLSRVREVRVEDVLRRAPVELDLSGSADYLSDRVVLVTGAGGSIGSEIVRQVARLSPAQVILFGQGENSLHAVDHELAHGLPDLHRAVVVGSIRDRAKVDEVMSRYRPDVVFHAAAHKHVPMMESHPDEAVLNNVGGTKHVAEAALEAGTTRFVNVSTDKAVDPVSMVGVSKLIAEHVIRDLDARSPDHVSLVSVRFGNVLGSRGSVVPIFQEQIARGGPLTLTHPEMTRYFMTIPEASRLVIQAGALSNGASVFVLDMGVPVRILDLATDMIRLSGADPTDIEIVYTGLRPGEKLREELFAVGESLTQTRHEQILAAATPAPDRAFMTCVDELLRAAGSRDWDAMALCLATLVPSFELGPRGVLRPTPDLRG